jgi:hypothetical protein
LLQLRRPFSPLRRRPAPPLRPLPLPLQRLRLK